ncbi:MAG: hypothetical protein V4469_01535 [Patescibacteria group bacterium]
MKILRRTTVVWSNLWQETILEDMSLMEEEEAKVYLEEVKITHGINSNTADVWLSFRVLCNHKYPLAPDSTEYVGKTSKWLTDKGSVLGLEFIKDPLFTSGTKHLRFKLNGPKFCDQAILIAQNISEHLLGGADSWINRGEMIEEAFVRSGLHGIESLFQRILRRLRESQ